MLPSGSSSNSSLLSICFVFKFLWNTRINSSGKSHSLFSGCLRWNPRINIDWTLLTLPLGQVVILTIVNNMTWCFSWPIVNLMRTPRSMTNANGCTYMKCRSLLGNYQVTINRRKRNGCWMTKSTNVHQNFWGWVPLDYHLAQISNFRKEDIIGLTFFFTQHITKLRMATILKIWRLLKMLRK